MRAKDAALAGIAFASILGLAACGQSQNDRDARQHIQQGGDEIAQGAHDIATGVGESAADAAITVRVKANLAAGKGLSSFSIHVATADGVVTLSGSVDSETTRREAARIASETRGVRVVIDKLDVTGA